MAPTTLVTFMVRTPSTTRSVNLFGSWDNFTKSYSMQRDSRIGPEHWSGCHKFSNIVFDGNQQPDGVAREGGLKMGGTYWYFYKLDDDLEFYNSAEPTTTKCPLLPGQFVNVLQVPYALSGNRSRNASVSSTSSEKRTLEPGDKYMNPRPVPKPKLHRLQTSPTVAAASWSTSAPSSSASRSGWSASSSKSSAPSSAVTVKMPLLSRKTSLDSHTQNQSPSNALAGSLKTALRSFRSPRSASAGEVHYGRARTTERVLETATGTPIEPKSSYTKSRSLATSRDTSPITSRGRQGQTEHDLAFRRPISGSVGSIEPLNMSSFAEHRRQRSRSREQSSLRNSLVLEEAAAVPPNDLAAWKKQLSTVKEVASAQNTPGFPLNGPKTADLERALAALNLEKRLPTLPNTPSSAYPASVTEIEPSTPLDIDQLLSHFSSTTIDTSSPDPSSASDSARFSDFSSAYTSTTGRSSYTESVIDEGHGSAALHSAVLSSEPQTPKTGRTGTETEIDDTPQATSTFPPREMSRVTTFSSSTVASTTASSLSTSPSEYNAEGAAWPTRSTSSDRLHYQHYRLPADDYSSEVTLKQNSKLAPSSSRGLTSREGDLPDIPHGFKIPFHAFGQGRALPPTSDEANCEQQQQQQQGLPSQGPTGASFPHSDSMQHFMHELSYLGDMIHR